MNANTLIERAEIERAEAKLRTIAIELRHIAPTISTRASALAQACELRRKEIAERQR